MNTSEVLNRAADLIETRGWGHGPDAWGSTYDDEGEPVVDPTAPLCLEGAIATAMGRHANIGGESGIWPQDLNVCPAALSLREYLDHDRSWLCYWNDDEGRTAEQVVEVLRAAAVIESAKETADEREPVTA